MSVNKSGATLTATYHPATADYSLSLSDKTLFPIAAESHAYPGVISSGSSTGAPMRCVRKARVGNLWPRAVSRFNA